MSEPAARSPEFTALWRGVSKLCDSKTQDRKTEKQMPGTRTSPQFNDFQSPKGRSCSRYPGLNNGDSPGDVEPSQDIFWDSTSPTTGVRNTRVVEISDIVNRIAPKDVKQKGTDSALLQWIGDSAVPCTPDIPKARMRKKSSRQSSVDDLVKLARQFDQNMQQDLQTSEQLNTVANNNLNECANASTSNRTGTLLFQSDVKDLKCPSSSEQVESELHALFDCSTQKVSGRLSQGSAASASSQEVRGRPVTSAAAGSQSGEKSAPPAGEKGSGGLNDDFDDDWENDDLLMNDSFVLAMTQNANQPQEPTLRPNTTQGNSTRHGSACRPTAKTDSENQPSDSPSKTNCSALQELCPTPKTTRRSTFKLPSNPHFQPKAAARSGYTGLQPKPQTSEEKSAPPLRPHRIAADQETGVADAVGDLSDSLWGDGEDDALLYQVCDSVERISNSQTQQTSPAAADGRRKATTPLPIATARSTGAGARANRPSPCAFVRSNSLPGTSCEAVNYQGWNIPMKSANSASRMSQSLPGSRTALGTFSSCRDSSGSFQVTAGAPQKSCHTAFKRNMSDSAVTGNKVFVTSQKTAKCSAAEIERKKQEALARRRQRMQNAPKP